MHPEDQPDCPLITRYTRKQGYDDSLLEKLFLLRNWDPEASGPVPFKWPSRLRTHLWSLVSESLTDIPLRPRNYQLQMMHHLTRMPRFICGDAVGLGKTLDAIMACCWLMDRLPKQKVIVLTTKTTTGQWADEFRRFSTLRPIIMQDKYNGMKSYNARYAQLEDFLSGQPTDSPEVMIAKYTSLKGTRKKTAAEYDVEGNPVQGGRDKVSEEIRQFTDILKHHGDKVTLILDEAHKFKGTQSQMRVMVQYLQRPCARVWAMTATAIKNSLEEFYSIASAIGIRPFGFMAEFREEFCIYREVHVGGGRHKQVLEGYRNVQRFRTGIRPFFLGRSQRQAKEPLPRLTTVFHPIDLSDEQAKLLLEDLPSGAFKLPPALVKAAGQWHERERDWDNDMTKLSVLQLVANHPALLDPSNRKGFLTRSLSPKEECLLDALDGEYEAEHVIVFTKYRSWIDRLQGLTAAGAYTQRKFLRITGAENEKQRAHARRLFQDPESGADLIFINSAATEGVNLQKAAHMFCLDLPWSFGDLIQLVGRMVRMASDNTACTLHILVAKGTIDEYAVATLQSKKGIFETLLGESHSAGLLDDRETFNLDSGMEHTGSDEEFANMMKAHAKSIAMRMFLTGDMLSEAKADKEYKMSFEPGAKKPKRREAVDDDFEQLLSKWN